MYTFQVPIHWQNYYQELTTLSKFAEGSSFQPAKHRSEQNAQYREEETLEEKVQETFVELLPKDEIEAN